MTEIQVLLVEDEAWEIARFSDYFLSQQDFDLIAYAKGAGEALRLTKECVPDAVILDLELEEGNGIQYLYALPGLHLPRSPYILVTTRTSCQGTLQNARDHGAGFIQFKGQAGYRENGPQMVAEMLRCMRPYFGLEQPAQPPQAQRDPGEPRFDRDSILRRRISKEIGRIGIAAGSVGHVYLVEAILIASKNAGGLVELDNEIYPALIRRERATRSGIEKAMRSRIEAAWSATDLDVLEKYYTQYVDPEKGRPELKEFIGYYANQFRR